MDRHASTPGNGGASGVLVLGVDRQGEASLLQRLQSLDNARGRFFATDDFDQCTLMVAHTGSAMLRVAQKAAAARPAIVFLTIDAHDHLRDGRTSSDDVIDDAALVQLLPTAPGAVPTRPPARLYAVPQQPLAAQLRERIIAASGHAALVLDGAEMLLLDFDRRLALAIDDGEDVAESLAAQFPRLQLQPLPETAFNARLQSATALPIAPLLWDVAQRFPGTHALLPPLSPRSALSLKQWPDFRALAHRHDHFRLCCLLLKRPSTAEEAARLLSLERSVVDGVFSAAYLLGHAEPVEAPRTVAPTRVASAGGARPASALARMWRSVRQGLQGSGT